ncbi:MAG: hypothetical protein IJQ34_02295 [Kiritimatiellae bacterium]|nr:hypothetical protein [Kiritimatiellia bacterium]
MASKMSLKEKAVASVMGVILLYALAVILFFARQKQEWKKAAKQYDLACEKYRKEKKLIAEKAKWADAYEEEKARMPLFELGKNTDTTWLQKMDELAAKHHVSISQSQGGKEIEVGEVLELPIEVKNWEGALESLVRFLHELENTDEGMFDVRSISFKPSNKKGYLKGSFILTCAYMREK